MAYAANALKITEKIDVKARRASIRQIDFRNQ